MIIIHDVNYNRPPGSRLPALIGPPTGEALRACGFDLPALEPRLFLDPRRIVRFGTPPFRIEGI